MSSPIAIPMACYDNYQMLDNPNLRHICRVDREIRKRCIMCEKEANPSFLCSECKGARYCSWECKVDDRQHHALVCSQLSNFSRRPSPSAARILIFPAQSTRPVFCWAEMTHGGEPLAAHDELRPFLQPWADKHRKILGRMGCINECRALAARKTPLGHGLFVLEWSVCPPPDSESTNNNRPQNNNISINWINKSILSCTAPSPENEIRNTQGLSQSSKSKTWLWTGPILVIALDLSRTSAQLKKFALDDINLRDLRHAIDFFSLNLRNPCLPLPPPPPTGDIITTSRFPFPTLQAIKRNETRTPLARALGITTELEEVCISRDLPPALAKEWQGVPVLCAQLGLAWVVRAVLAHGPEMDWLYDDDYERGIPFGHGWRTRGGVREGLNTVLHVHEETGKLGMKRLPRSGDGVVFFRADGGQLRKDHVQALLGYVDAQQKRQEAGKRAKIGEKYFKRFWEELKARGQNDAAVPSPYELRSTEEGNGRQRTEQRFLFCKEVFARLMKANS
ncbi:hypothetical protein C8A03DRAFT_37979 [Achaetomium macrosporum]|uniref:MYND-type domain-containing protein n=1 Tax=Achaetomium macrosporum TaxID=79813 RepID=A0AAN7C2S4_9PEZI|nr:hypothetical protein C8A03DRAFT_37979 [Achaetomium macrosporum]